MKIGIITFHCAENYGAVLQTYATQQWLLSKGHDAYIIDYRPEFVLKRYKWLFVDKRFSLGYNLRNLLCAPERFIRHKKFKRFMNHYYRLVDLNLDSSNHDFDVFIFGSDQIWNARITGNDLTFFAQREAFKNTKCITLAVSEGGRRIDNILSIIGKFEKIGVREFSLHNYLNSINIHNSLNCDPTILAGVDLFLPLCKNTNSYIVVYQVIPNDLTLEIANKIAKKTKKRIKIIKSDVNPYDKFNPFGSDSVESFISYIRNATYVVTTSFHATVFSILFKRPFYSIDLQLEGNDRVFTLLEELSLTNRLLSDNTIEDFTEIDYHKVDKYLDCMSRKTKEYLFDCLSQ